MFSVTQRTRSLSINQGPVKPAFPENVSFPFGTKKKNINRASLIGRLMTTYKEVRNKVCLLGDGAVGKTSLIRRYVLNSFSDDYIQTVGTKTSLKKIEVPFPEYDVVVSFSMMIWDILGQRDYRSLHSMYFRGAAGGILVFDNTRPESLLSLEDWRESFFRVVKTVPLVVLGNKWDLQDNVAVPPEDREKVGLKYNCPVLNTSALTGENVEEAFMTLARIICLPIAQKGK
jgi:small GTP-binding protein